MSKNNLTGNIFLLFLILVFVLLTVLITVGCSKSDYQKALSGEDITTVEVTESIAGNESNTINSNEDNASSSDTLADSDKNSTTDTEVVDKNTIKYIEKSLKINAMGAFHSEINSASMQLELNRQTGQSKGFLIISYTEAALEGSSTMINTSVLKGTIIGTVDMKSLVFKGNVQGKITADRTDYFSGDINTEINGQVTDDMALFTGNFMTPSYVVFDFVLERD
jgi:hypothetical protein